MMEQTLRLLLDGQFICNVRFKESYENLQDEQMQEEVNVWLGKLDMRLARLGDDGAFFIAPNFITAKEITKVKEELRQFRDAYGPAVVMLDFIRQSLPDSTTLSPGDYIRLADLEHAVIGNASMEEHLKSINSFVKGYAARNTVRENVKKLVEHLKDAGYLIVASSSIESYQVTGKIEQLYAVMAYIAEHEVVLAKRVEDEVNEEDMFEGTRNE
jgi:hypothetical protein